VGYEDVTLKRLQRRGQRVNGLSFLFTEREHDGLFVLYLVSGSTPFRLVD
jgi:hypothetical protein